MTRLRLGKLQSVALQAAAGALLVLGLTSVPGCQLIGGIARNAERMQSKKVDALYRGLQGKSFAVLVSADRAIQGEHIGLVDHLTTKLTDRLANPANVPLPAGRVPAADVLAYQVRNPSWPSRSYTQLAQDLGGVERIILVEVTEYRLHAEGNAYEWAGVAAATVTVIETDAASVDIGAFTRSVVVPFPDQRGMTPQDVSRQLISSALAGRLIDRVSWMFYNHEEPGDIKY